MELSGRSLVILGCGYVGTALAKEALNRGMSVSALTRNVETAAALRKMGVQSVIEAELDSADWHSQISPEQDFVVNTVSSAGNGIEGYKKSYLAGQRSVVEWAKAGNIRTYLYTSATSVYPQTTGEWVDETSVSETLSPNGEVLREAETVIENSDCFGRWFVLRLSGIYGPGRHFMLDRLQAGETVYPGSGSNYLNLIHLEDICGAVWFLLNAEESVRDEIFNVSDDSAATKETMLNWMAEAIGAPKPTFDPNQSLGRESRRRGKGGALPNRRIANEKLKALGWKLKYPTFREGYRAIIENQA